MVCEGRWQEFGSLTWTRGCSARDGGAFKYLRHFREEGMRKADPEDKAEPLNPSSRKVDLGLGKSEEYV